MKAGDAPVAIVIPRGFADRLALPGTGQAGAAIQLLRDPSDMVAPQVVAGLLQKVAMTSVPELMLEKGSDLMGKYMGELTAEQRRRVDDQLGSLQGAEGERVADPGCGRGHADPDRRPRRGRDRKAPPHDLRSTRRPSG